MYASLLTSIPECPLFSNRNGPRPHMACLLLPLPLCKGPFHSFLPRLLLLLSPSAILPNYPQLPTLLSPSLSLNINLSSPPSSSTPFLKKQRVRPNRLPQLCRLLCLARRPPAPSSRLPSRPSLLSKVPPCPAQTPSRSEPEGSPHHLNVSLTSSPHRLSSVFIPRKHAAYRVIGLIPPYPYSLRLPPRPRAHAGNHPNVYPFS